MRSANYVEETTTSIAGTNGDGAVTLTQITNVPRFSTVFGTQATDIRYVIEDATNKKFETGVGSVASNILTRTKPQVTWDGTTYDDTDPSPLQFGSSPTSGNIKIRMSSTAESQGIACAGMNRTISGDAWFDYSVSGSSDTYGNGSSRNWDLNTEYYFPYQLPISGGLLSGIQIEVGSNVASSGVKTALYSCSIDGLPGNKLVDFNVLSAATTGYKTDTTYGTWTPAGQMRLTSGWYYVGMMVSSSSIALMGAGGGFNRGRTPLGRKDGYGWGACISKTGGNYTTGLPAVPNLSGATMLSSGLVGANLFIGLKVLP